jgi:Putative adhesin
MSFEETGTMNDTTGDESADQPEDARPEDAVGPVRRQGFDASGPIDLDVSLGAGRMTVVLQDEPGVSVEIRHDPTADNPWLQGINDVLNWFGGQFGGPGGEDAIAAAVEGTRVELAGSRLLVHTPKRARTVPLGVTVRAPSGSNLLLRAGSADITVTGQAGRVTLSTGSGNVALDRADGPAVVTAGSGALRLGPMLGGLRARSGSGEIEVSSVGGSTTLLTGSGDVWLGAVQSDVQARTGSGDLTVADAACGKIDLITGSGEIRVGVRSGSAARVDLRSGSGQARSELTVSNQPPADAPKLAIRGRTGSGNAVVTAAIG